ncbi:MAG: hypothetical protein GXP53_07495 [Deltaproteobacteria bacterium]|nr:hypothetical protein [Deltaproteobacteria bacterium]
MYILYIATGLALLISLIADREKTHRAVKISVKKLLNILPAFITMLVLVSIVLYLVPDSMITALLSGRNIFSGTIIASIAGSITLMPGFIAYPLCGILLKKGVTYMVLSAFSTTLMMVGVLTFPIEKAYFGTWVTILRNLVSFGIAIAVAVATGIVFGEISL